VTSQDQEASSTNFNRGGEFEGEATLRTEEVVVASVEEMLAQTYFRITKGRLLADTPTAGGVMEASVTPAGEGVAIAYDYVFTTETGKNELSFHGELQGDEMAVTYQADFSTAAVVMGIGTGMSSALGAQFACPVTWLPTEQWPPLPPANLQAEELPNGGIRLSWSASDNAKPTCSTVRWVWISLVNC
jgi:hypothetical protein